MKKYELVRRELMAVEQAAWWHPRLRRILKAAPLVVLFLLLNTRAARAACSFNPAPDPTVDGSANSLRAAIEGANASGQDCLIELQAGTYTLTIKNTNGQENAAAQGDLDITDSGHTVTIEGQSPQASIVNGGGVNGIDDRVFQVLGGANAVFSKLTIEGGVANDDGTAGVQLGKTEAEGGGILVQGGGHVVLSKVWLNGNQAIGANGSRFPIDGGQAAAGGGLFLSSGTVDLTDCKLSGNGAVGGRGRGGSTFGGDAQSGEEGAGGGLYVLAGSARLLESSVSGNSASGGAGGEGGEGGECFPSQPPSKCETIGIAGGPGGQGAGAGLYVVSGSATLITSQVSGNHATGGSGGNGGFGTNGGGVGNGGVALGAGIFSSGGIITLANSTLFANQAKGGSGPCNHTYEACGQGGDATGGGLYINSGSLSMTADTVAANQAQEGPANQYASSGVSSGGGIANAGATSFITNASLIANNTQNSGNADNGNDVSGSITASYSLIGQSAGATITNNGGNLLDIDPLLDTRGLRSNGGPTQTVALQAGSPAIDAVPVANCTDQASPPNPIITDQRFFPRPDSQETQCDIGAYEYQDTAFIHFSQFGDGLTINPSAKAYYVNSPFTLGAGGTINPPAQPVAFGVGSYAVRLPVGAFVQQGSGYLYQRRANGKSLRIIIAPTGTAGQYELHVEGSGITPATAGPVAVTLTIGNNSGTSLMTGKFD